MESYNSHELVDPETKTVIEFSRIRSKRDKTKSSNIHIPDSVNDEIRKIPKFTKKDKAIQKLQVFMSPHKTPNRNNSYWQLKYLKKHRDRTQEVKRHALQNNISEIDDFSVIKNSRNRAGATSNFNIMLNYSRPGIFDDYSWSDRATWYKLLICVLIIVFIMSAGSIPDYLINLFGSRTTNDNKGNGTINGGVSN